MVKRHGICPVSTLRRNIKELLCQRYDSWTNREHLRIHTLIHSHPLICAEYLLAMSKTRSQKRKKKDKYNINLPTQGDPATVSLKNSNKKMCCRTFKKSENQFALEPYTEHLTDMAFTLLPSVHVICFRSLGKPG